MPVIHIVLFIQLFLIHNSTCTKENKHFHSFIHHIGCIHICTYKFFNQLWSAMPLKAGKNTQQATKPALGHSALTQTK